MPSQPNTAGETVDAAAVLQLLKDFGVDNLPTEEDLKAFQYDAEDLEEAVTHCASPTLTLPFLPDTNLVVSKIQDPVDTATQKPLSELAAVGVASESVPDQSDKTVQTPTDEATETAASISGPARDPPNDVEETQRFADNHDWSKGRILDFDRGYVQFDEDGKIELSTCTVKFEIASDGQKIVTFVKPDDLGIDQEAAKALNNSAEANPNTMDYPMMDLQGRPRYAFNQAYRLGFNEDGSLIMRAPDVHVDHYNYAEHMFLGNELHLRFGPDTVRAADRKLRLANGLELSYGQINGLGGDFFGGFKPICQGKDFEEQCKFFTQAYGCLGEDPNAVAEVDKILKTREEEVAAIGNAVRNGTSAAAAYKKMAAEASWFGMKEEGELQLITVNRPNSGEYQAPSYLRLAQLNLDHFGDDARTAYSAGHYCAMGKAAEGNLDVAYAMNAFADHYLGDCFAAGHMRTPRRFLHAGDTRGAVAWGSMNIVALAILLAPDLCSKFMHDEDNFRGLYCQNPAGEKWQAFGDKRMFEPENVENSKRMRAGLQASADEIWASYEAKTIVVTNPQHFAAFKHTPTSESLFSKPNHSPLFTKDGRLRKNINDPDCWEHLELWAFDPWIRVYQRIKGSEIMKHY